MIFRRKSRYRDGLIFFWRHIFSSPFLLFMCNSHFNFDNVLSQLKLIRLIRFSLQIEGFSSFPTEILKRELIFSICVLTRANNPWRQVFLRRLARNEITLWLLKVLCSVIFSIHIIQIALFRREYLPLI